MKLVTVLANITKISLKKGKKNRTKNHAVNRSTPKKHQWVVRSDRSDTPVMRPYSGLCPGLFPSLHAFL
jgi:hypothetical protein